MDKGRKERRGKEGKAWFLFLGFVRARLVSLDDGASYSPDCCAVAQWGR